VTEKPPYGSPCNNCGLCCINQPCPLAFSVMNLHPNFQGRCPALRADMTCDIVAQPHHYSIGTVIQHGATKASDAAAVLIGAGIGCDAQLEGEETDPSIRERIRSTARHLPATQARIIWQI